MNPVDTVQSTHSESTVPIGTPNSTASDDYLVTGIINRLKVPNATERNAVLHDSSITTVMLSIDSVRRLVEHHDETASTYLRDDQTVITTTTTHDEVLKEMDWTTELDLIRRFGPDYHIPTEYSVYQAMPESQQNKAIDDCMEGTEWVAKRLENHATEVLVQAKGWSRRHFARCRPTMERLETDFVVFYATGYKNRVYDLLDDLQALISELQPSGILLIGKQSTRFLSKAPPEVVAAAGGRWWRQSGLAEDGHSSRKHSHWKTTVEAELASGQATLGSYASTEVSTNG
jgi:hypothetical protein